MQKELFVKTGNMEYFKKLVDLLISINTAANCSSFLDIG